MEINGGCLCGAVRYTADGDPTNATVCHCKDCQKFTGSVFATLVRVDKEGMNIEGALKTFSSIGGSGNPILRHFCPRMRLVDRRGISNAARHHRTECRDL